MLAPTVSILFPVDMNAPAVIGIQEFLSQEILHLHLMVFAKHRGDSNARRPLRDNDEIKYLLTVGVLGYKNVEATESYIERARAKELNKSRRLPSGGG